MGRLAKFADSEAALLPKEVGVRLRQFRRKVGLTQANVASGMCRPGDSEKPRLDSWAAKHELPPEPFAKMKQAVIALFAEMALRGELD